MGFEPTVGFPTLDFESSALNRTQPPFQSLDIVDRILGCAILGSAVCLQRRSRTRAFNLAGSAPLYDRLPLSYTRPNGAAGFTHCPVRSLKRVRGLKANASPLPPEDLDKLNHLAATDVHIWARDELTCAREFNLAILGGCCGTDERYIEALAKAAVDQGESAP